MRTVLFIASHPTVLGKGRPRWEVSLALGEMGGDGDGSLLQEGLMQTPGRAASGRILPRSLPAPLLCSWGDVWGKRGGDEPDPAAMTQHLGNAAGGFLWRDDSTS